jgi:hypothetical protein
MPEPIPTSTVGYKWFYSSLHILAGNISNAVTARYPTLNIPAGSAVGHTQTEKTTLITSNK